MPSSVEILEEEIIHAADSFPCWGLERGDGYNTPVPEGLREEANSVSITPETILGFDGVADHGKRARDLFPEVESATKRVKQAPNVDDSSQNNETTGDKSTGIEKGEGILTKAICGDPEPIVFLFADEQNDKTSAAQQRSFKEAVGFVDIPAATALPKKRIVAPVYDQPSLEHENGAERKQTPDYHRLFNEATTKIPDDTCAFQKYTITYQCYAMSRKDVPQFMNSLKQNFFECPTSAVDSPPSSGSSSLFPPVRVSGTVPSSPQPPQAYATTSEPQYQSFRPMSTRYTPRYISSSFWPRNNPEKSTHLFVSSADDYGGMARKHISSSRVYRAKWPSYG